MSGYREARADPYRSPDALIEHLCTYMNDDKGIAAQVKREFGGTVTEANVRAARKRIAKPRKEIEPDNDSEWVWRQRAYAENSQTFARALRKVAR